MRLIIDTHVHFYTCYEIQRALINLRTNLSQLDRHATCMAFLAERSDCNFFAEFEKNVSGLLGTQTEILYLDNALLLREKNYSDLYIFPGRQVITEERIEILSLMSNRRIEDGLKASEVLQEVEQAGGLPVLSWAPGKWFFQRKQVVKKLIDSNQPGSMLIGDTTLRPTCWPMPFLMKKAAHRGFRVVGGSDPLPFAGEERFMGRYGTSIEGDIDIDDPAGSIRSLLKMPGLISTLKGERGNLLSTCYRLIRNAKSKT